MCRSNQRLWSKNGATIICFSDHTSVCANDVQKRHARHLGQIPLEPTSSLTRSWNNSQLRCWLVAWRCLNNERPLEDRKIKSAWPLLVQIFLPGNYVLARTLFSVVSQWHTRWKTILPCPGFPHQLTEHENHSQAPKERLLFFPALLPFPHLQH